MRGKIAEDKILIAINALKNIMSIFLGPFLTAYFIKRSSDTLIDLSLYYILSYILLALLSFTVMRIIKRKFRIGMFRTGVIINFFYIMSIIILNESIIKYLWIVSILSGISASTYWMPYNLFAANKVTPENRTKYTLHSSIINSIISIAFPALLGAYITITNYELTAMIMLFVSFIQIVLSFYLSKDESRELPKFNVKQILHIIVRDQKVRKLLLLEFFTGMNLSGGALGVFITVLIFNSFKTNMNLGIITSLTTILSMIAVRIYAKIHKKTSNIAVIKISSILPIIAVIILLLFKNNITVIIYNVFYVVFTGLLGFIREIELYNVSNNHVTNEYQCEFWALREAILNYGRLMSYTLLLLAGVADNQIVLNIITIFLTITIAIVGYYLILVKKEK